MVEYIVAVCLVLAVFAIWWLGYIRGKNYTWDELEKRCGKEKFNSFVEANMRDPEDS